jgi:hypothetical protein
MYEHANRKMQQRFESSAMLKEISQKKKEAGTLIIRESKKR